MHYTNNVYFLSGTSKPSVPRPISPVPIPDTPIPKPSSQLGMLHIKVQNLSDKRQKFVGIQTLYELFLSLCSILKVFISIYTFHMYYAAKYLFCY